MRGKTLSNEKARAAIEARRQQKAYNLLESDFEQVGAGIPWDEFAADRVAAALNERKDKLLRDNIKLGVNSFDRAACVILHRELGLPPNLVADDGFWRWLAVEKFASIVEARSHRKPALLRNYGVDAQITDNRIAILWFRVHLIYDRESSDPYHLARRAAHTDFWESGIVRPGYARSPNLARTFVRFQYREPPSDKAYLHSTHPNGVRRLYKRLRRLHTTIWFEHLSDEDIWAILEEKSADLIRA